MNHTFGYVLCCQSPALFLLAIALVIDFFVRKDGPGSGPFWRFWAQGCA